MGELKDIGAVRSLVEALSHRDAIVRRAAVDSLGKIAGRHAVEPIARLIQSEQDRGVLRLAERVLQGLTE